MNSEHISRPKRLLRAMTRLLNLDVSVHAGFTSPAEDTPAKPLDLNDIIQTGPSTYMTRIAGCCMEKARIFDGDYAVIEKTPHWRSGNVVIAVVDGEFVCRYARREGNTAWLEASDSAYPAITHLDAETVDVWGVVTHTIRTHPPAVRAKHNVVRLTHRAA